MRNLYKKVERLKRINFFIQIKVTGRPKEFADKLGISRSSVYDYINELRKFGAEIDYCRKRFSFYYLEDFKLIF